MKKTTKILSGVLTIVAIGAIGAIGALTTSSALAYQGHYAEQGPSCSPERYEAMTGAMENGDYETWSELMTGHGRVTRVINADNFAQFAEAHRLGQAGDIAGADKIRGELGLRTSNGEEVGAGYAGGQGRMHEDGQGRRVMDGGNHWQQ